MTGSIIWLAEKTEMSPVVTGSISFILSWSWWFYWVWQPAGLDYKTYINTYMQYKRKLGLYIKYVHTVSLQVALKVREWIRYERILKSVRPNANCWIFHRRSQLGYKISVTFGRKQIMKHVGLVSYLSPSGFLRSFVCSSGVARLLADYITFFPATASAEA